MCNMLNVYYTAKSNLNGTPVVSIKRMQMLSSAVAIPIIIFNYYIAYVRPLLHLFNMLHHCTHMVELFTYTLLVEY